MRKDLRLGAFLAAVVAVAMVGSFIVLLPGAGPRTVSNAEIGERFTQGVVMLHAKQYEHALTAFHRVLALDPAMPEAHVNAGFALLGDLGIQRGKIVVGEQRFIPGLHRFAENSWLVERSDFDRRQFAVEDLEFIDQPVRKSAVAESFADGDVVAAAAHHDHHAAPAADLLRPPALRTHPAEPDRQRDPAHGSAPWPRSGRGRRS